jgi:epoxyqueuosine reductase
MAAQRLSTATPRPAPSGELRDAADSARQLADHLMTIARNEGLDACGVCSAKPFDEARRALQDGLKAGRSAGMQFTYRNPRRSSDPSVSMQGARGLFVAAKSYARQKSQDRPSGPAASVAMYSWSDHYKALRNALGQVGAHLEAQGWRAKVLVDDNALIDRAAAVRAGLGWYGKNTNVLLPRRGSWFVLGSVLTDAPLDLAEPEADGRAGVGPFMTPGPVQDGCGACTRCIEACPTGALDGEGHLDARLCLAWQLQAPGIFPRELRVAAGNRIYGCDDCQEACPVNRVALRRRPAPKAEDDCLDGVDLIALLRSDDGELMKRFGRWYIPERDPAHLRRNALIALGNTGDPSEADVTAVVAESLGDPDPLVRAHAVWAAARLGRHDLLERAASDRDPAVIEELRAATAVEGRREACKG